MCGGAAYGVPAVCPRPWQCLKLGDGQEAGSGYKGDRAPVFLGGPAWPNPDSADLPGPRATLTALCVAAYSHFMNFSQVHQAGQSGSCVAPLEPGCPASPWHLPEAPCLLACVFWDHSQTRGGWMAQKTMKREGLRALFRPERPPQAVAVFGLWGTLRVRPECWAGRCAGVEPLGLRAVPAVRRPQAQEASLMWGVGAFVPTDCIPRTLPPSSPPPASPSENSLSRSSSQKGQLGRRPTHRPKLSVSGA